MKRSLSIWQFAGFAFSSLLGALLHFLYDWTDQNTIAALFSAVNESTWEHMKLLFFPMFLFALVQSKNFSERTDFWCVKLIGIVVGLAAIPVLFYTYNGMFGKSPDWVNIVFFFAAASLAYLTETRLFRSGGIRCRFPWVALAGIILIGTSFMVFTFFTPQIPLFLDPVTGTYGIR